MKFFRVTVTEIHTGYLKSKGMTIVTAFGNKEDSDAGHMSGIMGMKGVVQFDFVENGLWVRN